MTRPDRESRFDDVDLTALTIVEIEDYLSKIVDRHVIIPDLFFARAYELRIAEVQAHVQREVAIRNRRETERQDGQADLAARVLVAANAWLDCTSKGLGSHAEHDLAEAVKAYRASGHIVSTKEADHE